ncbi:MAG: hypothetical protein JW918_10030 [Anaerolineae bacterium]|nr:hypothetical protein [Anaerolineae bacterium]
MNENRFKEHLADIAFTGVAMAFVGGAAGFFSNGILGALVGLAAGFATGVGISVVLVAIYSNADGRGQPISVVPPVDTILSSHMQRTAGRPQQTDHAAQECEGVEK